MIFRVENSLHPRTVRDWIQSIRAKQKAKRDRIIFKLSMLGWTQEEIANVTGINQQSVSNITKNGEIAKMRNSISDWLSQGKTVEEAAEKLEIDATLAWAVHLQGKWKSILRTELFWDFEFGIKTKASA